MVCQLTKMAHFVPCHKEITAKESADLFISNCYILHGVPKVIVSDRDPKFVGNFWQSFMGKLNTTINMSTARHPRTDSLPERVNTTMLTILKCYCEEYGIDWTSHLRMVEFYYRCLINEASTNSQFEVMYRYPPSTLADRLLPMVFRRIGSSLGLRSNGTPPAPMVMWHVCGCHHIALTPWGHTPPPLFLDPIYHSGAHADSTQGPS
jgi:hypothetical protein